MMAGFWSVSARSVSNGWEKGKREKNLRFLRLLYLFCDEGPKGVEAFGGKKKKGGRNELGELVDELLLDFFFTTERVVKTCPCVAGTTVGKKKRRGGGRAAELHGELASLGAIERRKLISETSP